MAQKKQSTTDWSNDIIAIWENPKDGIQFCLKRNGLSYFRHGPDATLMKGSSDPITIENANKYAQGHGFGRLQKYWM